MGRPRGLGRHDIRGFGPTELGRALHAGWSLGSCAVKSAVRPATGTTREAARARAYRETFERLGVTYVKLGQLAAGSPLFPDAISEEFGRLLDEVPPFPAAEARAVIQQDLGRPPHQLFDWFDPQPMASASVAQVHAARTSDGRDVVVKVQRPGIHDRLASDLRILMRAAYTLDRRWRKGRMINLIAVIDDLAGTLEEELNFRNEARSMERYEANLRSFGSNEQIRVPEVLWELTSDRVLTMERIRGCRIDDVAGIRRIGADPAAVLKVHARSFLESALHHGFFHGDMHAGNIMVDEQGRIVVLDFGIVGRFHGYVRDLLRDGLAALFMSGDCDTLARNIFQLSPGSRESELDEASDELARVLEPMVTQPLWQASLGNLLMEFVQVGAKYDLRVPHEIILLIKQVFYVERYIQLMAPDWVMFGDADLFASMMPGAPADGRIANGSVAGNGNGSGNGHGNGHGTLEVEDFTVH